MIVIRIRIKQSSWIRMRIQQNAWILIRYGVRKSGNLDPEHWFVGMWHTKPRNPYGTDLNFFPLYCSGFKIEADHVVLGAGETFAALIHYLTAADNKRCSWDGKLTFREFFGF